LVLETAYEVGIRHFDVAPMYGLGMAEPELASFIARRRDECTITTKFGIDLTPLGRMAGRIQRPVRMALHRSPNLGNEIRQSGQNPTAGWVGRMLYSSNGYNAHSAAASLDRSLTSLGTDYIDIFLLHDPGAAIAGHGEELIEYLDGQMSAGRIRSWGVSGDTYESGPVSVVSQRGQVTQSRDDLFEDGPSDAETYGKARITFGILERTLPAIRSYLERLSEDQQLSWGTRLGIDLADGSSLANLLLRNALHRNPTGPVLFGSTRVDRVSAAAEQAGEAYPASLREEEVEALAALVSAAKSADRQRSELDN
jgi:D-threo-aldose 1-dehydrogenase